MSFECLLPIVGTLAGRFLSFSKKEKKKEVVFVNDEIPITSVNDETGHTQTGELFKVVALKGLSVAGKKADSLERALLNRATFFRNIASYKTDIRIISRKILAETVKKTLSANAFLNDLVRLWESTTKDTYSIAHYLVIEGKNEAEINEVVKECFVCLADLEPKILTDKDEKGYSPLLSFLSSFYNAEEFNIVPPKDNQPRLDRSRIKIGRDGIVHFSYAAKEKHTLIFGVKDFSDSVSSKIFDTLLSLPYAITVNIHVKPVLKTVAMPELTKRKMQLNLGKREINSIANREISELTELVESNKVSVLKSEFTILLTLDDMARKTQAVNDVFAVLGEYGVRPVLEEQLSMPKFWGQAPGRDYFNRDLLLTSLNLADLTPLTRGETGLVKCDWGNQPVCFFPSAPAGNPFGFTFHATVEDLAPPHCAVFAPTGSGKSVLLLHLISQALAAYPDLTVYAMDRDSGLTVFTEIVGGAYHQISQNSKIKLNPFDCDADDETTLNLFMKILTNANGNKEEKDIRLFVSEMLKQPSTKRRMDNYFYELAPNGTFKTALEKWVTGNTLQARLFNADKDTLNIGEKRLNVFGLDDIKDDTTASAALFFYLFKKIEKNAKNGKPSLLIVDEAATLLSSAPLREEIEKLLKTARKQRMAIFMAFQGTNDIKSLGIKEAVLTNVHTRFFYSGSAATEDELDGFNLTESETDFVLTTGAKINGAQRPILMQRAGMNVFLDTDLSCLGNHLNAFKGGAKALRFWEYAKRNSENPTAYYLKHYGER